MRVPLASLLLDHDNPRFGGRCDDLRRQDEILNFIANNIGVDDLLSSLAVNGFFQAEPLLVRPGKDGRFVVIEGNRRLVACLILANDPRANGQKRRVSEYGHRHKAHGSPPIEPIPIAVFDTSEEVKALTSYLGVKHIVGAQQWDSFAKAAWVARILAEDKTRALKDVEGMIGDDQSLARRMLMGYYVTDQLVRSGRFTPATSRRKGSRSNSEFPFSWVYTALTHTNIIDWLRLPREPKPDPIPVSHLDNAERLFIWMFGDDEHAPAIEESRGIKDLAHYIGDINGLEYLRRGQTVSQIASRTKPSKDLLSDKLQTAYESLNDAFPRIVSQPPSQEDAERLIPLAGEVAKLAARLRKELVNISSGLEDTDGAH